MKKKNVFNGILALLSVLALVPNPAAADEFIDGARVFLQSATDTHTRVTALCSGGCEAGLSGPLGTLGGTLGPLRTAIDSGSTPAILSAIDNTNNPLQLICTALNFDCSTPPMGSMEGPTSSIDGQSMEGGGDFDPNCPQCIEAMACVMETNNAWSFCTNAINEFVGCRKETPFCDYGDHPFTSARWASCLSSSYYRNALYFDHPGGRSCRCSPGHSERQGGCPEFFDQDFGRLGIPDSCQLGDGQGCGGCCYNRCQLSGDGRSSCQSNNQWECDVCKFTSRIEAAGSAQRASLCDAPHAQRFAQCQELMRRCITECPDTTQCCDSCGCHPCSEPACPIWP